MNPARFYSDPQTGGRPSAVEVGAGAIGSVVSGKGGAPTLTHIH